MIILFFACFLLLLLILMVRIKAITILKIINCNQFKLVETKRKKNENRKLDEIVCVRGSRVIEPDRDNENENT